MKQKEFELLAPAGSFEILKAVIEAGADAVYVGGGRFGARAYANNFSEEELLEAIDYVHLRGRQIYLTINTLLKNEEIEQLYEYLLPYYERGLDAVLVQDFGVLQFIHKYFPELPIHTSTQMTVTGVEGVRFLQQFGVSRVVMAREVSLEEMKYIHEQTGVELEAFVHGALCYCYSGQCLFSSMLGGRSGNRGRCAQPCRLAYSVLDASKKEYLSDSYILSLKDLCGIADIQKLNNAGIFSLKIEGRMKQAEYAAGVVSIYRKYIDQYVCDKTVTLKVLNQDYNSLVDLGNRCGFTNSYYHRHNDNKMVTFVKPNYATDNDKLHQKISEDFIKNISKIPVSGYLYLRKGELALLTVTHEQYSVCVNGALVSEAKKQPVQKEELEKRLRKTGDTSFEFKDLVIDMEDGIFLPNGAVNQLRREGMEGLTQQMLQSYYRKAMAAEMVNIKENSKMSSHSHVVPIHIAEIESRNQLLPVLEESRFSAVYIHWDAYDRNGLTNNLKSDLEKIRKADKECFLVLPDISRKVTMEFLTSMVNTFENMGLQGFVVKTYEELYFVKQYFPEMQLIIDHCLYSYNNWAVDSFLKEGALRVTVPLELNKKEIRKRYNWCSEMIVYGHYPLMTTAQCVHCNTKQCDRTPTIHYLKDRYQKIFPVKNHCNECYNTIYNSVPTMLVSQIGELNKIGIQAFRWRFTIETPKQMKSILKLFEGDTNSLPDSYTKGHYKRGVE